MKKELCNGLCELTNEEMMVLDGGSTVAESATRYIDPSGGWSVFDGLYNFLLGRLIWSPALYNYHNSVKYNLPGTGPICQA